ncbi:NAD-dependent epimerase/dehydratase family protein [Candidatus Woesearchaeota archaeon]|jgi:UDP-glucose 4-epimerase|nr:NAD-dependent epimerase/dehydratase family protein [Candidatus Woesearchaeota archaeon]|tara:strand:- start:576 stop:1559 length:984 start_codon:yes stop_codon:yes gene_type:complete
MNILITGVAGLLGSNLADWIIDNTQHKVVGIDDLSGGYKDHVNNLVNFYDYNILDDDIEKLFQTYDFDIVFHFAAYAAEGLSPFVRQFNYQNNLVTTSKLVTLSIKYGISRLVFTSSMAVYGNNTVPFKEMYAPQPIDPYGIAKMACERDIQIAGEQHGLDWCIIRPHNVYGEKQNIWDKYRNVLGIWMNKHLNGEPVTLFGDGTQRRAFSYIGDSVEPLWKAGIDDRASKQIINLGGITDVSIKEAADTLIEVMDGGKIVELEQRHEVHSAYSTYSKSVELLDFEHKTNLKEGLTKMWKWAQLQPKRKQFKWKEYELDVGLYEFWK